jgi:hypothetical protein
MGNQQDSGQTKHKYLTSEELSSLHQSLSKFKDNARLGDSWDVVETRLRVRIEEYLRGAGGRGPFTLASYQQLAGRALKGTQDDKFSFLRLLVFGGKNEARAEDVVSILTSLFSTFQTIYTSHNTGDIEGCRALAVSLLHDTLYPGLKRKQSVGTLFDPNIEVDIGVLENVYLYNPILEFILNNILAHSFNLPHLQHNIGVPYKSSIFPLLSLLFLNFNIPNSYKDNWRPVFSIREDGESFSKFSGSIINRGPTLIIIKDDGGNIFGGFCSTSWKPGPNFVGSSDCFLFQLYPQLNVYDSTPFNTNYQYFNLKQKTMPNGLGMGGQLEYFGFWIDAEFGIVRSSPSCSTFHSPQLGVQEGRIAELEVWGVGAEPDQDGAAGSVLNMDPELQAVMEMMGKSFHSKGIREADQREEKEKEIEKRMEEKEKDKE